MRRAWGARVDGGRHKRTGPGIGHFWGNGQCVISNAQRGGLRYAPCAFTEQGESHDPNDNNFAFPPVATVFTVSVLSVANRSR